MIISNDDCCSCMLYIYTGGTISELILGKFALITGDEKEKVVLRYNTKMKIKNPFQAIMCSRLFYQEAELQNPAGD